jgi:hypothetical protein
VLTVNVRGLSSIHKRVVLLYSGGVVAVVTHDKIGNPEYQKKGFTVIAALHYMIRQATKIHPWASWHYKIFFVNGKRRANSKSDVSG